MAKVSNDDYLRDAAAICDRLDAVEGLNRCSRALVDICRTAGIGFNDGRWAFEKAGLAVVMHNWCTKE
jgi:hypothetical protein